jgi:hypothetical protein
VAAAVPWLAALGVAVLLVVTICLWPLRFDINGQARGEADGSWVVAGGVSLAAVSLAFAGASGVPLQLSVLLFGRKLAWQANWRKRLSRPVPKRVKAASQRAWARVDPLGLALKLVDERRHTRLRYLVLDLKYGFRDPLLTGRLMGAISALSAVLPRPVEIRQAARWDFEDGWQIGVDGRAIVRPWLMLLDIVTYVVRQSSHERKQDLRSRREPAEGRSGDLEERNDHRSRPAGG